MRVHVGRSVSTGILALVPLVSLLVVGGEAQRAQIDEPDSRRTQGTMSPSFDGWIRHADGTSTLYFGYLSRNATEVNVPVGPDNRVSPAPTADGDHGQPTTFHPARHRHAFRLDVPAAFNGTIAWTLSYAGSTETVTGSLRPLYLIDALNNQRGNQAPVSNAGPDQTVTFGTTIRLQGTTTDDGFYIGRREREELTAIWMKYRGPGKVTFDPIDAPVTTATFSAPGTYVLRLRADDAVFVGDDEVTITVTPVR